MTTSRTLARSFIAAILASAVSGAAYAGTVGFEEEFALSPDRTAALKQLIPGTEDYYFYTTLNYQNQGKLDEADKTLKAWIAQHNRTARAQQMENRQALLKYTSDAKSTLAYLSQHLGVYFNHERETPERQAALPTTLDPAAISRDTLSARALNPNLHADTLNGFEDAAFEWLDAAKLSDTRLHELLSRLVRPDYPKLPELIAKDMAVPRYQSGFGSLPIHAKLLLSQLEELITLRPNLLNDSNFVSAYLSKLRPTDGLDWRHDAAQEQAYLERLQAFADRLAPAHNSLKANILFQRLSFDRKHGVYDRDRLLTYLKLPRRVWYINPKYIQPLERQNAMADLNADYSAQTILPPISNDEPLVRDYLLHLLADAPDSDAFTETLETVYLRQVFAEAKIATGIGDQEKWFSLLPPAKLQELKDRVDLDFALTNPEVFKPDDAVALDVNVKNVSKLIVKVYEVNAANYYKTFHREVSTAVNLDGLVANEERTETYSDPALRRIQRHFEFKNLAQRGVYVVEFIGNGKSSRALIRKGKLHFIERTGAAGHNFVVLDEANKRLLDARIWIAGHEYPADKDGDIAVPYTAAPGNQPVVLLSGGFASLDSFSHKPETYRLEAGIHIPREALLRYGTATVAIRPALMLGDSLVTPRLLENVTLVINSVDQDGIATSKEIPDFKLFEDRESDYDLSVPDRLASITFSLRAKVQNVSANRKDDLLVSRTFAINGIDASHNIQDLHLSKIAGSYVVDVLGKSGELRPDQAVNFVFQHRDFREAINATLKSDPTGRITLGPLDQITSLTASGPDGSSHTWHPTQDLRTYNPVAHAPVGKAILVPYMGAAKEPARPEVSLLETRGGTYVVDRFANLAIKDGFLQIQGLPAGEYSLLLKEPRVEMTVRIAPGDEKEKGWVLSANQQLQVKNANPLQIVSVIADAAGEKIAIQLGNATKSARVHVFATHFVPEFAPFADLASVSGPTIAYRTLPAMDSLYESGRTLGDEYRYIIDRKYANRFPGNMLARPGLLLNPWAIRATDTGQEDAKHGNAYADRQGGGAGGGVNGRSLGEWGVNHGATAVSGIPTNLDFLAEGATELLNLIPDDKGVVTIDRKALGSHQQIHVVAVDPYNTIYREISLAQPVQKVRDLRMLTVLDSAKHFTQQKQVSILQKGDTISLPEATGSNLESFDSLAKVYRLYSTLHADANLVEFSFILNWPTLKPEEKREKYSKYACHELSYFLSRKDPEFFTAVILPYLKNKKDKTFMDHFLLGDDLSGYMKPWAYGRLNTVERVLLAQHLEGEAPKTARALKDQFDLLPPAIDQFNMLFDTAIKAGALETGGPASLNFISPLPTGEAAAANAPAPAPAEMIALGAGGRAVTAAPAAPMAMNFRGYAAKPTPTAGRRMAAKAEAMDSLEKSKDSLKKMDEVAADAEQDLGLQDGLSVNKELAARGEIRQLYRKLDKTMEWVENNYYHLPIEQQLASLIDVNGLWKDYAQQTAAAAGGGAKTFLAKTMAEPTGNFTEMMFALSVLDLPFESPKHESKREGGTFTLTAGGPIVAFHKEIKEAQPAAAGAEKTPILVSQNYFRETDRYTFVDNERTDKYVGGGDEFLTHVVYGAQVVITNPTSSRQKLDALLQLPKGAVPVLNAQYTRGLHLELQPYETKAVEYSFYFPATGEFEHYPVQVAKNEKLVAFAPPATLKVVAKPTKLDTTSWDHISQNGTEEEVLTYLKANNIQRVNLEKIAWRMKAAPFYKQVIALLEDRHIYNTTLWSYALKHNDAPRIREYLQYQDGFVAQCGAYLDSPLLTIDPTLRYAYQHMEYAPLVNPRAHKLGQDRKILNERFFEQYERTLNVLTYRPTLSDDDTMSVTYYMLLQDRIDEGLAAFKKVDPKKLPEQIQYDYFAAYTAFYGETPGSARAIADKYKNYPVDRWRNLFVNVLAQVDEVEGKAGGGAKVIDKEDRNQQQNALATTEPTLEFTVDNRKVNLVYKNVPEVRINYYLMDIELMFSQNPFLAQSAGGAGGAGGGQFSLIKPNATSTLKLDSAKEASTFDLPKEYLTSNVMIEITAAGVTRYQAYYANSLALQLAENYGQLTVTSQTTGKVLPKAYVKVYARMKDGRTRFYKDGYSDLRGKFDYTSLNTDELDQVDKFSLLIMTDSNGAVVREALPPKR